MPLFEYACDACGERFEVIQKFSDVSQECRKCGKGPVHRLQSAPGIQFKGTGWYVTDYAKKSGGESSSAGKSSDGEKAETKKSDSGSSESSTSTSTKSDSSSSESSTPASTKSESTKSDSSKSTPAASAKD